MRLFRFCLLLTVSLVISTAAQAQTQGAEMARAEVRFSQMDEKLREIQGKLEELDYENRRLREALDRFQQDTGMRLTDLESRPAAAETAAPSEAEIKPAETEPATPAPAAKTDQVLKLPSETPAGGKSKFSTPRELYDHAFRLLNQTQYDEAGKAFENFIATYPSDPLIGNAYYWAGETYYVRQNFTQSADKFRQGYEALPTGPKAGDNLLKLGMALRNMQREKEACVVLKQVIAKFGSVSGSIKNKAEQEKTRAGCA